MISEIKKHLTLCTPLYRTGNQLLAWLPSYNRKYLFWLSRNDQTRRTTKKPKQLSNFKTSRPEFAFCILYFTLFSCYTPPRKVNVSMGWSTILLIREPEPVLRCRTLLQERIIMSWWLFQNICLPLWTKKNSDHHVIIFPVSCFYEAKKKSANMWHVYKNAQHWLLFTFLLSYN